MPALTQQDKMKAFIVRRHPHYGQMIAHWSFLEATYEGGREWFAKNIHRGPKEGKEEYDERVKRAYRFPHTKEVVDLVNKYLFKADIRQSEQAPEQIKKFWSRATRSGLTIEQYRKLLSTMTSIFGQIAVFVDSKVDQTVETLEDEKKLGDNLIYSYFYTPKDILDLAFDDDDGELLWILVREYKREDYDPIESSGNIREQFRLWTRDSWTLYEEIDAGQRGKLIRTIKTGVHGMKEVPCKLVRHNLGENRYTAPGLIDDVAYLDKAVANYLSNLDVIIQDQTFSQLVMPAQGVMPGDDKYATLIEAGTKRIFTYDGSADSKGPTYISPDAQQAQVILAVIAKIINEIYSTIGLAGERTKEDNSLGIDNSSGVAKAYDFEKVNALLNAKGETLENAENWLVRMVARYAGIAEPKDKLVEYPKTFDTATLLDELATAEALAQIAGPTELRREQMIRMVEKLFPMLAADVLAKIKEDIRKEWLKEDPLLGAPGSPPTKFPAQAKTQSRQGQVTPKTGK